ncbi:hypothetical protein [Salinihabitans flavidus]|nr:hypothetical protein [Salinihabitans flavidus]
MNGSTGTSLVAALTLTLAGTIAPAQDLRSPLEEHVGRQGTFETGNQIHKNGWRMWTGAIQTNPEVATAGTGNQIYMGGMDFGVTPRTQLGFSIGYHRDPTINPVAGASPDVLMSSYALQGKYRFYEDASWSVHAAASLEYFSYESAIFGSGGGSDADHVIGSLHLPISYNAGNDLRFHLTPGIAVFTDNMNGNDFFGTIPMLGVGASWKPHRRWLTYGSVNMPFGENGNTVTSAGTLTNKPIWTLGAAFNVTPKTTLDLFVTNGMGGTPATSIIGMLPDADTTMIGATVTYTPGRSERYRPNYRGTPAEPLSRRQEALQHDGYTLTSADTLTPGAVLGSLGFGTDGGYSGAVQFSPDYDGQMEFAYDQVADDGSVATPSQIPSLSGRYMFGVKLRFLDQNNGSPVSLSGRALIGRDTSASLNGVLYLGMPVMWKANDRLALTANPKFAAFGSERKFGVGLGVNYELANGLQAIAEVTPVNDGDPLVWAAGVRYRVPGSRLDLDLSATNAIGRYGIGTMVAQDDARVALTATYRFDARRR